MRYSVIMAGGSGVRLWPMSRQKSPKQLLPLFSGKSLLELAAERLKGLIDDERQYICAGQAHREPVLQALPWLAPEQYLGEPVGRDTLNAVGFSAAVIGLRDPEAVIGVFTADHLIEPVDRFQACVERGYRLAEQFPNTLVTFGIRPTFASTGYGYLQLGREIRDGARVVEQFKEKPGLEEARTYFEAGPDKYLWNSGMFVWRASTLLDCIRRFAPVAYQGLSRIAEHWECPDREEVLAEVYPQLPKISVDYAVMEPASRDSAVQVAAIPMELSWMDVGSWATFAATRPKDEDGNASSGVAMAVLESHNNLVVSSDPSHLVALVGCEGLAVIHTPDATLVCRLDKAERVKQLQELVAKKFGERYV